MEWYILQTKPNGHTLAQEHLSRQGFEVFLPLVIKTSKQGVKFVDNYKPLFPGYIFLGTTLNTIPWKSINATRGVSKVVTLDGQYRAMSPEIIESIKIRCDQNGVLQQIKDVTPGDLMKIEKGPFTDFVCTVEKITDRERIWVLIDILQKQTPIGISLSNLSKIC